MIEVIKSVMQAVAKTRHGLKTPPISGVVNVSKGIPVAHALNMSISDIAHILTWDLRGDRNVKDLGIPVYDHYALKEDLYKVDLRPITEIVAECVKREIEVDGVKITDQRQLLQLMLNYAFNKHYSEQGTPDELRHKMQSGEFTPDPMLLNTGTVEFIENLGINPRTKHLTVAAGEVGATYGYLWRDAGNKTDSLGLLIEDIISSDRPAMMGVNMFNRQIQPYEGSGRLDMVGNGTFFKELNEYMFTINEHNGVLDMSVMFGVVPAAEVPTMIARYALLLHILAMETKKKAGSINVSFDGVISNMSHKLVETMSEIHQLEDGDQIFTYFSIDPEIYEHERKTSVEFYVNEYWNSRLKDADGEPDEVAKELVETNRVNTLKKFSDEAYSAHSCALHLDVITASSVLNAIRYNA